VFLRAHSSDSIIFRQLILDGELNVGVEPGPQYILDAGANVGLATLVLAGLFPTALIVAVEPDPANSEMLRRNVSHLSRVRTIEGALWCRNESVVCAPSSLGASLLSGHSPTPRGDGPWLHGTGVARTTWLA